MEQCRPYVGICQLYWIPIVGMVLNSIPSSTTFVSCTIAIISSLRAMSSGPLALSLSVRCKYEVLQLPSDVVDSVHYRFCLQGHSVGCQTHVRLRVVHILGP